VIKALLSFNVLGTTYPMTEHNIPEDFKLHKHILTGLHTNWSLLYSSDHTVKCPRFFSDPPPYHIAWKHIQHFWSCYILANEKTYLANIVYALLQCNVLKMSRIKRLKPTQIAMKVSQL
jgi:hypothetical protein